MPPEVLEVLLFRVDTQRYALRASEVREVLPAARLTPLPRAPAVVEGLLDVRGKLLPVLDLRRRFGSPARALAVTDHLVVVQAGARRVALRVDRAEGLERLAPGALDPAPARLPGVGLVAGALRLPEGPVLLADLATFLSEAEALALETALGGTQG